jgi:hypothetical protein
MGTENRFIYFTQLFGITSKEIVNLKQNAIVQKEIAQKREKGEYF